MAENSNPVIELDGVPISRSWSISFVAGTNVDISVVKEDQSAEITISATPPEATGAPTEATYLVGSADNTLTNEIVVGTTPGGELGGTWASPTVDSTHAGSAHHTQAHAINSSDHTGTLDDAQIPATIARDSEVSSAVSTHEAAVDPHSTYLTAAEGNAAYEASGTVATHAAAADPHSGYLKESNTIDFLVGTATTELAGEVVVGTSPGGELGNTWASPTVDASHSGSTHAATQAAAESTASSALTTHAGAVDPHTGYRLESADHTHASTGIQAGTIDHGVITGLSDDDHPQYALDTDLTTHAGAADPHTGYLKESNTIDFLVGTATAELGGEMVVGTSPGGELGGTWASPTVDSTHSGSAHHAQETYAGHWKVS